MPDSNVYGPVAGLWSTSNRFHSPIRETLYRLPYPLRNKQRQGDRPFPHNTPPDMASCGSFMDASERDGYRPRCAFETGEARAFTKDCGSGWRSAELGTGLFGLPSKRRAHVDRL
jgi:hypothetical protein